MNKDEADRIIRKHRNKAWTRERRRELMSKATRYEWRVFKAMPEWMRRNAVRQRKFQHQGFTYFFDIYIPCAKVAIEVDGGYHNTQLDKDAIRDKVVSLYGIKTFRITNERVCSPSALARFVSEVEAYCVIAKFKQGKM